MPHTSFRSHAPGRVNLIGEHTDYNDGWVLPVAINLGIDVEGTTAPGRKVTISSRMMDDIGTFSLDEPIPSVEHPWLNYVIGLADGVLRAGHALPGMEMRVWGDLPVGAGMSSSAAFQMALLGIFERAGGFSLEPMDAVRIAQQAEHAVAGVRSGVMDGAICRLARHGHALLLDCRSLTYRYVPINLDAQLVVCNTGVRRELATSAYNERRRECEEALEAIRRSLPEVTSLRDVSPEAWGQLEETVPEPARRRARYVIAETERVLEAAEALEEGEVEALVHLFAASQAGLRDDYEVSSPELDALVDIAGEVDPRIASRMTGAGFGGCTVHLVPPSLVSAFERRVMEEYPRRTGREAVVYRAQPADGARSEVVEAD